MKTETASEKWILDGNFILTKDGRAICDLNGSDFPAFKDVEHGERIVRAVNAHDALVEALEDMLSGWRYIRQAHGDLYGVGWDRAQAIAEAALALAKEGK